MVKCCILYIVTCTWFIIENLIATGRKREINSLYKSLIWNDDDDDMCMYGN